ncbi:gmc oxidoreductase [Stemphylium lycopersici]|uniref:Gmc oxidoreductase n=1 Tax=Stemphylium lycopersici TaxID=183478 RepID=A0A364MXG8_STELY|nr:gmc oxidoreductase [Stemphylium lycopersici]
MTDECHNLGKVLDGTSALNLLVWNRTIVKEHDAWEELGNPGWGWNNVYPAIPKTENFQRQNGSLQFGSLGVMYQPATHRVTDHTRSYSVNYIPAAGENLVFMFNTTVHKVRLSQNETKVSSIILLDGTLIKAKKKVVLSAGSLLSPKLLELSCIDQKQIVQNVGVKHSCYGFLKRKEALGNNQELIQLGRLLANKSNPIDRKKLALLTDPDSGVPDLEVVFSDRYIGTTGYLKNGTAG